MITIACECTVGGPERYVEERVGVDDTNGRYGDVDIRTCGDCGRRWLHYRAEYEAFTGSGRWIVGILPDELPMPLTPTNAVPILNSLPWYIFGGGAFSLPWPGRRSSGNAPADFMSK
jgi:hypothetical protein